MSVLTHVDGAWESLGLSEDGEPVVELSNGVIGLDFINIDGLNAHERNGDIERACFEGSSATIESIEDSINESRTSTSIRDSKSFGLKHN